MENIQIQSYHHYLLRAKWVLPILSSPIFDGAIEIKDKKITKIGTYKELSKEVINAKLIDFKNAVIMPALTNAHTHLELSALKYRIPPSGSFILWVRNVIKMREQLTPIEMKESAKLTIEGFWKEGIGIIGDVGNIAITLDLLCQSPFYGYFFQEVLNFQGVYNLKELYIKYPCPNFKITYSAHAPHTVAPLLIQAIKSYNKKRRRLFCIHCAESLEEVEFLQTGKGQWAKLLKEKGIWNDSFIPPKVSPVKYLNNLGVLDENTLLIHAVYVDEEDIKIIKEKNVKICICPKSNIFIGVGIPKLKEFLNIGIEVCIGTDSFASNDHLSIWDEIKVLHSFFTDISIEELLKMATYNGAHILGFSNMGAIMPAYKPNLIIIEIKNKLSENLKEFLEDLVYSEKEVIYRIYV